MNLQLDRRKFLNGLMAIVAAHLPAGVAGASESAQLSHTGTLKSMRFIGKAYLQLRPYEANREFLLTEMQRALYAIKKLDAAPSGFNPFSGGAQELRALIRSDFTEGRTVKLEGWVLSVSECRICALLTV